MHPVFNPVAPYLYLLPNLHLSEANIANPDLLVCGSRTWISLDIARFYEEHCQPSSGSAWPACPKTVIGPHCWGWEGSTQFARVCQTAVTAPPRVGCVVWRIVVIPSNHFLNGFPDPSQFTMARRTHYSTMQHRPLDSSRPRQCLLPSGGVHQNPGPATKYPSSVCTSNVTSRGVNYMCNHCSGWVHSKCSGLQNAAEYHQIKNWACSSPPHRNHHQLQLKLLMRISSPFCNSMCKN